MAKKQRRKQQTRQPDARPQAERQAPPVSEVRNSATPPPVPSRPKAGVSWDEFRGRYSHVNAELKQIGILAGSFLVVLLILAAVLS
jgi:hypothetical protein